MLKSLARHLLMLGVLFGLASHGIARDTTPCREMSQAEMTAMHGMAGMGDMPGCAEMQETGKSKAPCKNNLPCCSAMASTSAAIALDAQPVIGIPAPLPVLAATWPAMQVLHGREITPEPDPPSLLG